MYVASQLRQNQWHLQKDAFADSLIPYYLQAKELGKLTLFFQAANHLLLDRFPPLAKRQHGVTKLSAMKKMKRSLALRIEVSALLQGQVAQEFLPPCYWKEYMSITADHARQLQALFFCLAYISSNTLKY
ncbi:hypothetical protein BDN71DRAFT_1436392 [Pleurotus eryngii]|uniref:Uncharacterized protein n=1 Tax=Pleurotus eryngii TaxID=5323 RepID=A0A9P6D9V9_PLEER|nr:hypothetical protein BDN71DRAFT_1436392 [Pleurotus eryngii]